MKASFQQEVWNELAEATILIVDDDEMNLDLLVRALRRIGCASVTAVSNPDAAIEEHARLLPDLVLLDYRLPPTDGFAVLEAIWSSDDANLHTPVIMLTGDMNESIRERALIRGVADFLTKDFDFTELLLRIRNVLRTHRLVRQVQRQKIWLEEMVKVRTRELEEARREVLERLALAAEYRDDQTGQHTRRVGVIAAAVARKLRLPDAFVEAIASAALLHDLGKIGVPDNVLLKPGRLTDEEFRHIRAHPEIGARILQGCSEPVLSMARDVALHHHEKWNGSGYPHGLAGEHISLCGRIVAVADAYDAMTSRRPYKEPVEHDTAVTEIVSSSGTHFDPQVVDAFVALAESAELQGLLNRALDDRAR